MTKNKNRKSAVREIAKSEGIGIARAGLINDRNRLASNINAAMEYERNLAWYLTATDGSKIQIHFDSDSVDTKLWSKNVIRTKRGIPHYLIDSGTQSQRFNLLDSIRGQLELMTEASVRTLDYSSPVWMLDGFLLMHKARLKDLATYGVKSHAELRARLIAEYGIEEIKNARKYFFLFIYDWDVLMADASEEVKNQVRFLIEHGKKTGIHIIASTGGGYAEVRGGNENAMTKSIVVQKPNATGDEYALINHDGVWTRLQVPVEFKPQNSDVTSV